MTGFTLIELMIVVAIIGILAAIAIPNFIKFQAKSKTAEARANLKGVYTAEKAYFQDHNVYGCGFLGGTAACPAIGFAPERGNRYAFSLAAAPTGWQLRTTGGLANPAPGVVFDGIEADVFKFPLEVAVGGNVSASGQQIVGLGGANAVAFAPDTGITAPPAVPSVVTGSRGSFAAVACANIDSDRVGIDKWFVASQSAAITAGNCVMSPDDLNVASGVPGRLYNDVDCDN